MELIILLSTWCVLGLVLFLKDTTKIERQYMIEEFNYASIYSKFLTIVLFLGILLLYPIAKICEILEGK